MFEPLRYDDKWNVGHRCRRKELGVIKGSDEAMEDLIEVPGDEDNEEPPGKLSNMAQPKISITLKEGSDDVSVVRYRYPQIQRDEIERLIRRHAPSSVIG